MDADILPEKDLFEKISESTYSIGTCSVKADSSQFLDRLLMFVKSHFHRFGFCTGLLFIDKELFQKVGGFEEDLDTKEDGRLLRRAKKLGKFGIVNGYVLNHMRRYRKKGYLFLWFYWAKEYIFPRKREYESVR